MKISWVLLILLHAATAGADDEFEEDSDWDDDAQKLTVVVGLSGGLGFEGHIDRAAWGSFQETGGSLDPSAIGQLYGEIWFHKWLGAGLLVDGSWVMDKGCPFCVHRWWGGFGVHGVAGTMIDDDVGFFWRVALGISLAEPDPGGQNRPGFFFGTWAGFRWFALPYSAVVLSFGLVRQAKGEVFFYDGADVVREVWILEGRAQLGVELVL